MEDFTHRINCFSFYDAEGFFKIQAFSKKVGMWLCVCGLNVGSWMELHKKIIFIIHSHIEEYL